MWLPMSRRAKIGWALGFLVLFALGQDSWNWGDARLGWLGYPWWLWAFAGLCVVTSIAFWAFARQIRDAPSAE